MTCRGFSRRDGPELSTSTNYATTENVNDALSWIQQQGTNNWFLWLAFNAPHAPLQRPPDDLHTYASALTLRQTYEAMTQAMDTELGRLLNSIDRSNTVVIFVGDNGTPGEVIQPPYRSDRAKFTLYEALQNSAKKPNFCQIFCGADRPPACGEDHCFMTHVSKRVLTGATAVAAGGEHTLPLIRSVVFLDVRLSPAGVVLAKECALVQSAMDAEPCSAFHLAGICRRNFW